MAKIVVIVVVLFSVAPAFAQPSYRNSADSQQPSYIVTGYSIVAWDSITGDLGVAVISQFLGVGAVAPYAKANVGALATQGWANTTYGPLGLDLLAEAKTAQQAVEILIQSDSGASRRQLGIVDAQGNAYAYTGSQCRPWAGQIGGRGYTVQGNGLTNENILKTIARMFEVTPGDLSERLLASLEAGGMAEGGKHENRSAVLTVVREKGGYSGFNDRFIDIRIDDDPMPLAKLRRMYDVWKETFLFDARLRSVDEFNKMKKFSAANEEMKRLVVELNSALRSKPEDPDVLNTVARTLATHDIDRERALELAKRAVKLAPDKLYIFDTMAECHFRLGHYDEAIAIEATLVTKDPSNDAYWRQLQKFKDAKQAAGH